MIMYICNSYNTYVLYILYECYYSVIIISLFTLDKTVKILHNEIYLHSSSNARI